MSDFVSSRVRAARELRLGSSTSHLMTFMSEMRLYSFYYFNLYFTALCLNEHHRRWPLSRHPPVGSSSFVYGLYQLREIRFLPRTGWRWQYCQSHWFANGRCRSVYITGSITFILRCHMSCNLLHCSLCTAFLHRTFKFQLAISHSLPLYFMAEQEDLDLNFMEISGSWCKTHFIEISVFFYIFCFCS